jgi:hypothetical protein
MHEMIDAHVSHVSFIGQHWFLVLLVVVVVVVGVDRLGPPPISSEIYI